MSRTMVTLVPEQHIGDAVDPAAPTADELYDADAAAEWATVGLAQRARLRSAG
jgi:hypothetical protein